MEKQKIFWVILSVTVFVVVVLVVGVFLLKKDPTALAASPASPSTTSGGGIYEFGREAGGDTEVLHFTIGGEAGTETGTVADAGDAGRRAFHGTVGGVLDRGLVFDRHSARGRPDCDEARGERAARRHDAEAVEADDGDNDRQADGHRVLDPDRLVQEPDPGGRSFADARGIRAGGPGVLVLAGS